MPNFFKKFSIEVSKVAKKVWETVEPLFTFSKLDDETIDSIEKSLYSADFGVTTTQEIIKEIKEAYKKDKSIHGKDISTLVANVLKNILKDSEAKIPQKTTAPQVICLIGINGSGKTTTAAKLAQYYITKNYSILFAACDTFRAAAGEQIQIWANRLNIDIIGGQSGSDSAAIAYDAYQSACAKKRDVLIIDTAGRLHVKSNLMNELKKIDKTLKKIDSNINLYNWLIIDGSIGSNSLESAKIFHQTIGVDGLIVTKLDGSSRGGTIVSIYRELKIPILFVGTGEQPEDLIRFSIKDYIDSIFQKS